MDDVKVFRHENYELQCSAVPVDGGRFVPSAVLTKQIWPTRPRSIAMRGGHYADQASAIEAARLQGMEWIAAYG